MTDQVFCYHCRRYHRTTDVMPVLSKGIKRWRCLKSIAASRGSVAQRDAFGQSVSEANRARNAGSADRPLPLAVLELFCGSTRPSEGRA